MLLLGMTPMRGANTHSVQMSMAERLRKGWDRGRPARSCDGERPTAL
ncbi:hypothetical protein SAMN05519103_08394 [Rhizobiales bacterium GAS113]|jgi:hypothetical protein|nr:hypothetical protein SAMN05519103_08394 [Rhizobiales bacterium GAS113]